MFRFIQISGLAVTMALTGVAMTAPASAQDMELRIGRDGVRPVIRDRDVDRRGCGEREARAAARDSGLRDPEIVRVTPRRVVVQGFTRRGPSTITFANERGCPEI